MPLTDTTPMPFGKYKGTPLQDVPVSYLHYMWTQYGFKNFIKDPEPTDGNKHIHDSWSVAQYIHQNLDALKMEDEDRIW